MKLIKKDKIIEATEKSYNLIYKHRGFEIYNPNEVEENGLTEQPINEDARDIDIINYDNMTKVEIGQMLSRKGIVYNPRDKKDKLIELLIEGD